MPVWADMNERVELSTRASSFEWLNGLGTACAELLHPSVTEGNERARQERLLHVLIAAPALASFATGQVVSAVSSVTAALLVAAITFGVGLLWPFALIATGRRGFIELPALICATAVIAMVTAISGGVATPIAAMSIALVLEAFWVGRTRKALVVGVAAMIAAFLGAGFLDAGILPEGLGAQAPSAWWWAVPLAYLATVFLRLPPDLFARKDEIEASTRGIEDIIGAVVLRLHRNGDVNHVSSHSREILRLEPEMLLGTGLFDRIHLSDRITYLEALADLREGVRARTVQLRMRIPADANPVGATYGSYVLDLVSEESEGDLFTVVLRDDATRTDLKQALENAKEAAEGAAVARDHFMASVSHELRTPLTAILGFSDVLANEMLGPMANERQHEYVTLIREASGHLLSVVNAVLDVSKVQSGSYVIENRPFDVGEAVRLSMAMSAREAEAKAVDLKVQIDENIGVVTGDRRVLQQVLINLVSNAVKFTPSGEVRVAARRDDGRLDFTVSDTGIGMSAEDLELVGKPFAQVHNGYARQGTGLGLALVKGLVNLQGGGMSIESAPGAGTRVHITLPAESAEQMEAGAKRVANGGAVWNGEWSHDTLRKTA